jgi:BASS family bile acid:Na+ symporter
MGIPIGAYAIWMFFTAGILMWQLGKIPNSDSK